MNLFYDLNKADINKRFICKGQIHKLLNQLASRFVELDLQTDHRFHSRKRSRSQVNPAYILNLDCPGALYDLTFEASKTFVQFKDWTPILTFIEEAIQQFWKEKYNRGEPLVNTTTLVTGDQLWKDGDSVVSKRSENAQHVKEIRTHSHQAPLTNLFSPSEMLTKDDDLLPHKRHHKEPCEDLHRSLIDLNDKQIKMEFSHQPEHVLQSWDIPLTKCSFAAVQNSDLHPRAPDDYFVSEDSFFYSRLTPAQSHVDNVEDNTFSSVSKGQLLKMHISMVTGSPISTPPSDESDYHEFINDENLFTGTKPFLKGCSSGRSFTLERALIPSDKPNVENDLITQLQGIPHDEVDVLKFDSNMLGSYFCAGTSWQDKGSCSLTLPRVESLGISQNVDFLSEDFVKSVTTYGDLFPEGQISLADSNKKVQNFYPSYQTLTSACSSLTSSPIIATEWNVDRFIVKDSLERSCRSEERTSFRDSMDSEEKGCEYNYDIMLKKLNKENCMSSCINNTQIIDNFLDTKQGIGTFLAKENQYRHFSPESLDKHTCQKDYFNWRLLRRDYEKAYESPEQHFGHQGLKKNHLSVERSRRSHSAPPYYKRKATFYSLGLRKAEKVNASVYHDTPPQLEIVDSRHLKHFSGSNNLSAGPCTVDDLLMGTRIDNKKMPGTVGINKEKHIGEISKQSQSFDVAPAIDLCSKETQESSDLWIKWKNCYPWTTSNDEHVVDEQISILDISSGFLSLAGNSLVPESIDQNFLEDAKVLLQLDKKFIPVVSSGILAVIDQHAADERIRLEDLRQKLLSGEEKTITFLDAEHELMLPEIGYQLLHNYANQVKEWGWICNIHAEDSKSFQRNLNILHKRETVITLMAVPCILGVNLSDLDLLEFLHQLADTDGSSTMPPSVLRVLNSKACRGAIMFGDALLPSECSLIVEELKQTSLCFQCAHGRPTTVPLVNLEALHKQIRKLQLSDDSAANGAWHGLRQHELSLERTSQRLRSAGCS